MRGGDPTKFTLRLIDWFAAHIGNIGHKILPLYSVTFQGLNEENNGLPKEEGELLKTTNKAFPI